MGRIGRGQGRWLGAGALAVILFAQLQLGVASASGVDAGEGRGEREETVVSLEASPGDTLDEDSPSTAISESAPVVHENGVARGEAQSPEGERAAQMGSGANSGSEDVDPPALASDTTGSYRDEDFQSLTPYDVSPAEGGGTARSGITSWNSSPGLPRLMALSAEATITASVSPASGDVGDASPRLRIDFSLPANAAPGDTYRISLVAPWVFGSQTVEVKDSAGRVFAIAKPVLAKSRGLQSRFDLEIKLTDEVSGRANISGFLDLPVGYFLRRESQVSQIEVKLDGKRIALSEDWRLPASPPELQSTSVNPITNDGKPAISPYIRIPFSMIEDAGKWTVTLSNPAAGLVAPACTVSYTSDVVSDQGWVTHVYYQRTLDTGCSPHVSRFSVTATYEELRAAMGLKAGDMVTMRLSWIASQPDTSYKIRLTTSLWNANGGVVANLEGKSGIPASAGASHQGLSTTKTAAISGAQGARPATIGDTIEYKIETAPTAGNTTAITGLVTTDTLPEGVEFISASGSASFDPETRTVRWGPRDLSSTGKFTDTVKVKVGASATPGKLTNTVTNSAENACTEDDTQSTCSAEVETALVLPSFNLKKSGSARDTNGDGWIGNAGDEIVYAFKVTNTGKVPIDRLNLSDPLLNVEGAECLGGTSLQPGVTVACKGAFKHKITSSDAQRGTVTNSASVCADPLLHVPCATDEVEVKTLDPAFAFEKSVTKIVDPSGKTVKGGVAATGDTIIYAFEVKNTGNTAIESVVITDKNLGIIGKQCFPDGQALEVGTSKLCSLGTQAHTVTDEDADKGAVKNTAVAKVAGLSEQTSSTETPVNPRVPTPRLPETGAGGKTPLVLAGTALLASGAGAGAFSLGRRRARRSPQPRT